MLTPKSTRLWSSIHDGSNRTIAMQLKIKSEEAKELANEPVELTRETKAEAVTQTLRERLDRVPHVRATPRLAAALDEIALHCSTLSTSDARSADEIVGYDENGLPR